MNIRIFYDNIDFRIKDWIKVKKLIEKVISKEDRISGDLNFILTNDKILKKINNEFLKHNFNTDVISFSNDEQNILPGEIYISIETVKRNARNYKVSCNDEIIRVIVHGVLHICGYEDSNDLEKEEMRKREDFWLKVYKKL